MLSCNQMIYEAINGENSKAFIFLSANMKMKKDN